MSNQDIFNIISSSIQEITGLNQNEIQLSSDLAEDLQIDPLTTLSAIIKNINQQLDFALPLNDPKFIQEIKDCETVADLVDLIESETEF